jgi:hypothetical protein
MGSGGDCVFLSEHRMTFGGCLLMALVTLVLCSGSCHAEAIEDRLIVEVGEQEELLRSGQDGIFCCPDLPLCVLEKSPLRLLMIGTEGTHLFGGKDWRSLAPKKLVLTPDKSSRWDNGYAGICGIHKKGSQVIALYHAEDHEDKTSGLAESKQANYAAYFSLGIAVSEDDGDSFKKKGQVITSPFPYVAGNHTGGNGNGTMCLDHTGRFLYAYYSDFTSQGANIQVCLARSLLSDRGMPGTWWKWNGGNFDEPGLGGRDTNVMSAQAADATVYAHSVQYVPHLRRYLMALLVTKPSETDGRSFFNAKESGFYLCSSRDGVHWEKPVSAFISPTLLIKGVAGIQAPQLHITGTTTDGVKGLLLYSYTSDFGRETHHLAGRSVTIRLQEQPRQITQPASVDGDGRPVLSFDGRYLVSKLLRFSPVTLEAWIRTKPSQETAVVIGSDIRSMFGVGVGITNKRWAYEYLKGFTVSEQEVPKNRWTHVAIVFGQGGTRLYSDGRLVNSGPATEAVPVLPMPGNYFVVGRLGELNPDGLFRGQMRYVRISKGERYQKDFRPSPELKPDETTVLLYDAKRVDGDRVIDLSGKGNDGIWKTP